MMIQTAIKQSIRWLSTVAHKRLVWVGLTAGFMVSIATTLCFLTIIPRDFQLAFQSETCSGKRATLRGKSDIGTINGLSVRIDDQGLCVKPVAALKPGAYRVSIPLFGISFLRQPIDITVPALPKVALVAAAKVPISKPLQAALSRQDTLHTYYAVAGERKAKCVSKEKWLNCELAALELRQGESYDISLQRVFQAEKVTVATKSITTLERVELTESSIKADETVYTKPSDIVLTFNKPLLQRKMKLLITKDNASTEVIPEVSDEGEGTYTLSFNPDDLLRGAQVEVVAREVVATDGSTVDQAASTLLRFQTSVGPKLVSSSIGTARAPASGSIVLTFDQPISQTQDIAKMISVKGVSASIQRRSNRLIVSYSSTGKCVDFSLTVAKGILSEHNVPYETDQIVSSRTVCHTVETIGHSVNGRPISAYFFGNGSKTVLFTGAIHGNEKSSGLIMHSWIGELEVNAKSIPADKRIVVVPVVSPDGYAAGNRLNARNVNLNRNWQTSTWISDGGPGGEAPMSEPEVQALAALTQRLRPSFVATYHSQGRIVNSNDVGSSVSLGQRYAASVRYRFVPDSQTVAVFGSTITGTYEDWLAALGIPAILMELDTNTGNHFAAHKAAMWGLVSQY